MFRSMRTTMGGGKGGKAGGGPMGGMFGGFGQSTARLINQDEIKVAFR